MNPRVKSVRTTEDYKLELIFTNGEHGIYKIVIWNLFDICNLKFVISSLSGLGVVFLTNKNNT